MAIETIRGRYRLHRFPPRQRHLGLNSLRWGSHRRIISAN